MASLTGQTNIDSLSSRHDMAWRFLLAWVQLQQIQAALRPLVVRRYDRRNLGCFPLHVMSNNVVYLIARQSAN